MTCQRIVSEDVVVPLLTKMRLPRWVVLELAEQIAGERANVSPDDAPPVAGFETWRWGIRYCREHAELKRLGWVPCEEDQVSGIRNDELNLKLVFCNTDSNTGKIKAPKNTNEKGAASCRLIRKNSEQLSLIPDLDEKHSCELWYFCAYFCDAYIAVEISKPSAEEAGVITDFSLRIIVAQPMEIPGVSRRKIPEEYAEVQKPRVVRKNL